MVISEKKALIRALNLVSKHIDRREIMYDVCRRSNFARESLDRIKAVCTRSTNEATKKYEFCRYSTQELWDTIRDYYITKYELDEKKQFSSFPMWVEARNFYIYIASEMKLGNQEEITKPIKRNKCTCYYGIEKTLQVLSSDFRFLEAKKRFEELDFFIIN